MSEETLAPDGADAEAVAATEAEGRAPEEEAQAAESETETRPETEDADEADADDDGGDGEQAEEAAEEIEFTFGNEKFAVRKGEIPDELAAKLDAFTKGTWADYTRKSQEVGEQRKAAETAKQNAEKLLNLSQETLSTYARGESLRAAIEQIQSQLTDELWQRNPDQARRLDNRLAQAKSAFQETVSALMQHEAKVSEVQAAERQKAIEEGQQRLRREIPEFDATMPQVIDFAAKDLGIDRAQAEEDYARNPVVAKWAYEAMKYRELRAKAQERPKPPQQTREVKPSRGEGAGNPTRDPSKMSMDEYVAWRNSQDKKAS